MENAFKQALKYSLDAITNVILTINETKYSRMDQVKFVPLKDLKGYGLLKR